MDAEAKIRKAFRGSVGDRFSTAFLRSQNIHKDCSNRLICWLVLLRLVDESDIQGSVVELVASYRGIVEEKEGVGLPAKEERQIVMDVTRTSHWFERLRQDTCVGESDAAGVERHAIRILRMLSHAAGLEYIQGYDRYVLVTYLLALEYTASHGLDADVAECLSFFLSRELLLLAQPKFYLTAKGLEEAAQMDDVFRAAVPETWAQIEAMNHSAVDFTLRWKLALFADEHSILGIWYLWDNIILNQGRFKKYLEALCVAHVMQVPVQGLTGNLVFQKIQQYKDWDEVQLCNVADKRVGRTWKSYLVAFAIAVLLFSLWIQRFTYSY